MLFRRGDSEKEELSLSDNNGFNNYCVMIIVAGRALAVDYSLFAGDDFISSDQVSVPISIKNNSGFMGFAIEISYEAHQITPIAIEPSQMLTKNV